MFKLGRIYRKDGERFIPGFVVQAFIRNGQHGGFYVVATRVYQDGMVDDWGDESFLPLEEFKQRVRSGMVLTQLPEGVRAGLALAPTRFTVTNVESKLDEHDFLAMVDDVMSELNDRPNSVERCRQAFIAYQQDPTGDTRRRLREAYQAVPKLYRFEILIDDLANKDAEFFDALGQAD